MNKNLFLFFVVLIAVFVGISLWWNHGNSAVNPKDASQKLFVIQPGEGTRQIGTELKNAGLINDPWTFYLLIKLSGLDGKIQAGDYRLSSSEKPLDIAKLMTKGSLDIWVTVPEGKRAAEIAEILKAKMPRYDSTWGQQLVTEEGYLFPDTYLFPHDASINQIIAIMTNNFEQKYNQAIIGKTVSLSKEQGVIIASILEREGSTPDNMKQIASVLENRLNIGMALQVDATVQYALGFQPDFSTWWKKELTTQDLRVNSPYNTYLTSGLPPTPISNPGLAALTAAFHPATTDYLYYISDRQGNLHFAKTLEQQESNIQKYGL